MSDVWVLNASPIITLAKAGHLRLLNRLADDLLVPESVASEVMAGPPTDPAAEAIRGGWGRRVLPEAIPPVLLEWGLGAGETAVLAVALHRVGSTAIIDDASARTCARSLGIRLMGTLGVVLRAKKRGLIPNASEVVRALRASGLRVDEQTIRSALQAVGEEWGP